MLIPRPIQYDANLDWDAFATWLEERFALGEEFTLVAQPSGVKFFRFQGIDRDRWVIRVNLGNNKRIVERVGILKFYRLVRKEIGEYFTFAEGSMQPMTWLLAGVDGVENVDRLCEAWVLNGGIVPKVGTAHGDKLIGLLKESNKWIKPMKDGSEKAVMEFIAKDAALSHFRMVQRR